MNSHRMLKVPYRLHSTIYNNLPPFYKFHAQNKWANSQVNLRGMNILVFVNKGDGYIHQSIPASATDYNGRFQISFPQNQESLSEGFKVGVSLYGYETKTVSLERSVFLEIVLLLTKKLLKGMGTAKKE